MVESLLEEKLAGTQRLLNSLIGEEHLDARQVRLTQALASSLEELNAAATEIQQQNEALIISSQNIAQERQRYQELFEITPDGYIVTDIHSRIQETNQMASVLLNRPRNYLINKPLTTFIDKSRIQEFLDLLDHIQQQDQKLEVETIIYPRELPSFPALLSVVGAYDTAKQLIGLRWLIHDQTQVIRREEERINLARRNEEQRLALENAQVQLAEIYKLSKLKNNFLSSISHELRSPISNIKLALTTLKKHLLSNAQSERILDVLQKECNREIRLIENLLIVQVDEEDAIEGALQVLETIQLEQWLPQILQPYHDQVATKELQFIVTIDAGLAPFFIVTSSLQAILVELINNAWKYTPKNGQITVRACVGDNSTLTRPTQSISVTNEGPRIPTSQLWRIFETFYRIPNQDPYEHGGTGLGLSLVLKFAQQLGATLGVQSSQEATTFTIELLQQGGSIFDMDSPSENFEFISGIVLNKST